MGLQDLQLRVLAHANLGGHAIPRADGAPVTGDQFQAHTQTARVGTVPHEANLELMVGIATVIAPKCQSIG